MENNNWKGYAKLLKELGCGNITKKEKEKTTAITVKKRKLYISLPITGYDLIAVKQQAEDYREIYEKEGYEVVTPFDIHPDADGTKPYSYYMGKDIEALLECDYIYLADGWEKSKGCNAEFEIAKIYGIEIL